VPPFDTGPGSFPAPRGEAGHGTGAAALAAGLAADAPGVAPAANLISIRVTGADGLSDIFTVARGITAAVDAGAQVINISLGGYATTGVLTAAIDYAEAHGALIVAAAGNDQATQLTWPAADPRVVSVGAVDAIGQQVTFSNSSPQLQISAPGYGVQTAWLDGQRVYVDGTSASAPIVAGAIAAVMSVNPGFTAARAWEVLATTASDAGAPGADADYGRGILNVGWAMTYHDHTRVDPAISHHYYDAANSQMDFVVQNRGGQSVSGLTLDVDTNGFTLSYRVPSLAPAASTVITIPVDQKTLVATGALTYKTTLGTPIGVNDQDPSNNFKTSRLTPPKK
ncbi:MAG: S8 family serine peptidase, partial [Undibacterium sp.]|nr:S8 family serine peptidase [Opitutaceae bacterium]